MAYHLRHTKLPPKVAFEAINNASNGISFEALIKSASNGISFEALKSASNATIRGTK